MIRRHPQDGATLVGRLDGYGPVADAILYHHEHVDGSGYPAGLIGNEIPLASRILAICSTYDTMTARDSYRSPMTPQDAMAELRRVAGRQLDARARRDASSRCSSARARSRSRDGDDADFEAELAFERRARQMAQPKLGSGRADRPNAGTLARDTALTSDCSTAEGAADRCAYRSDDASSRGYTASYGEL